MTTVIPRRSLATLLTYEEFRALPDDGPRYELIEGELVVVGGPSFIHQMLSGRLYVLFDAVVTPAGFGWVLAAPFEVKFAGANAVQPDLVVVLKHRAHLIEEERINGAPDLIVENLSPSNRGYDLHTKAELYARFGVPEYWVVDPRAAAITVNVLRDGAYVALPDRDIARSRVIPGLVVDVRALFAAVARP